MTSRRSRRQIQWGSITVSLDNLSLSDRLFVGACLLGVLLWMFPHVTLAQTVEATPLVFEVNNLEFLANPQEDYLARFLAAEISTQPIDPRVELMQAYLAIKDSPLAGEAETLLKQYHFRLILGIAFAESNFCKIQIAPNNCWGIGGSNPESYETLSDGIMRANGLIQKYQDLGMTTPKWMRDSWVGWPNDNWILAVEQITQELEALGL